MKTRLLSFLLLFILTAATLAQQHHFVLAPTAPEDRAMFDRPFDPPDAATSVVLSFKSAAPHIAQGVTIHLKNSPISWRSAKPQIVYRSADEFDIICRKNLVTTEGGAPSSWAGCDTLRISFWRQVPGRNIDVTLVAVKYAVDPVAVCLPDDTIAPGATWLAAGFADRVFQTFSAMAVGTAAVTPAEVADGLPGHVKLLVIPFASQIPSGMVSAIAKFLKSGGKVVTYYTNSPGLATRLGMQPAPYRELTGDKFKMRMIPTGKEYEGGPVYAPTWNLLGATSSAPNSAAAYWQDFTGRTDTGTPACTITSKGVWFSHVPPMPTPAAVAFTEHLIFDRLCPTLPRGERTFGKTAPSPRTIPDMLGVWFHHPGSGFGSWDTLAAEYAQIGVTDFFVNLQAGGTIFFRDAKFPGNAKNVPSRREDSIDALLAAGKTHNLKLHAWVTCFTALEADAEFVKKLRAEKRLMQRASGDTIPWLCPSSPENVNLIASGINRLAEKGFHGIHLDFIRYPDADACYCAATKAAFVRKTKLAKVKWPADVLPDGKHRAEFMDFRAAEVADFLAHVRKTVKKTNPDITLSVAVFPNPASDWIGQRWADWVKDGLVDYVMPMAYADTATGFAELLANIKAGVTNPDLIVPGIGYSADESRLDAAGLSDQIAVAAETFPKTGVVIFSGDAYPVIDLRKIFRKPE